MASRPSDSRLWRRFRLVIAMTEKYKLSGAASIVTDVLIPESCFASPSGPPSAYNAGRHHRSGPVGTPPVTVAEPGGYRLHRVGTPVARARPGPYPRRPARMGYRRAAQRGGRRCAHDARGPGA